MNRLLLWFALLILFSHAALGADIVVYDDASHNPPFDQGCSFGGVASDFDFANPAPVHAGSASIRFTPEQFNAVSWCGNTTYSTANYSAITFWAYLGSAAQGDNIDFVLSTLDTVHAYASLNTIYGAAVPVGVWTQLHTAFSSAPLNYTGSFDHLSFQDETGATNYDIFGNGFDAATPLAYAYFDDVVLQSAATITFTVTASAGSNGSISPVSQITASGSSASFTVTPNAGHHVTSVVGDHCTITQQGATTTWLSSAITQNCAVTATFAINTYTVTPSVNGGNGSISPNTPQTVNYNATKSFMLTPNAGYHIGGVGGTCGGTLSGSTYTTSAVTANCTVIANFTINTYTVTPSAGAGGSLTPGTPQTVNYNATTNFTVAANAGNHVVSVSGCGGALVASTYTTGPITANCTVTATFASDVPPPACGLTEHPDQLVALVAGQVALASDVFDWCDSLGHPREAVLVHNDVTGNSNGSYTNHGGSLQRFSYQLSGGATRTATVTDYGNGGYGGFGYVVSHSYWNGNGYCAGDDSPLGFTYKGTWTRVFEGRHHAIFRFQQNYQRHCGPNPSPPTTLVPVTIDWVFSTGRDNPVWAITYDMSGIAANFLYDDSRAPYGELNIDGTGFTDIDGTAWGDKYKFASTTAPVTLSSSWTWNTLNTVPYVKEWLTAVHGDATMGVVQTQPIGQQDAGGGRTGGYYPDNTQFWGKTSANGNACINHPSTGQTYAMPCQDDWPYQANNDSLGVAPNSNNNARLTWGTQYGFLGQSTYASNLNAGVPDHGPALPGWPKKSYSTYVVLGQHSTSPVEAQVTQVETAQSLTLSATTGSVVTSGPAGVNRADTITYDPPGYDHIYGALAFNAASNVLDANINVGAGTLKKPLVIVHGYTSASYPASVKLNGTTLVMDTDYFPSLRGNPDNELWITLNKDLSGATNHLQINPSAAAPSQFRGTTITGMESGFNGAGTQHICLQAGGPVAGTDYPTQDTRLIDYYASKSVSMLRPLFAWECVQPVLNGPIPGANTGNYKAYFDAYKMMVDYATNTKGMGVIIEPWEAASDNSIGGAMWNGNLVGSVQVPRSAFADFWGKMATIFKDNPRVSYGLMSEPNHMSTSSWFASAQAAITAIRATGSTQRIYVPGNGYTAASTWTTANAYGGDATSNASGWLNANGAGLSLSDPASNIAVEVHTYVDCNQGGLDDSITSNTAARDQLDVTVQWARPLGYPVYLGEIGIYAGNAPVYNFGCAAPPPGVTAALAWSDFINYADANTDTLAGFTWWAGGYPGWWDDLHGPHFSITPTSGATFTGDSVEMTLIQGSF